MIDTLFGIPYGLTHEDMTKSHHLFTATAKKTPYQLDLEVKDRKPDIVPKVGDKVKIKSREWYEKWKNEQGDIDGIGTHRFVPEMSEYCGKVFKIKTKAFSAFTFEEVRFGWIMSMFEEVYPQELLKEEKCTKGLYSSSISASALGTQLTGTLEKEEPELQTIKKHRFIKLEKL